MHLLEQAAIFLLTAVLLVPLARRAKLGAVLGYLAAGMVIGPWGMKLVGEVGATMEIAEFGVVLLLFLIGLELDPKRLWVLRRPVFGLGGAQVTGTTLAGFALALAFGVDWRVAIVVGVGASMTSTALMLASLAERSQLAARHGREAIAVSLFQDIAVIPVIALLPLLAIESAGGAASGAGWQSAAKGLGAIIMVIVASRIVVRPALKAIAVHGGREVFTAAALLLVIGAALLMQSIGLSASLGAFLAGVLLADSEFRHELEADIEPFKGLLLGLFFMAVGMSVNLDLLAAEPVKILLMAVLLLVMKILVMYPAARLLASDHAAALRLAVTIAPGGEFAFVLFGAAAGVGVIDTQMAQMLVLVAAISMLLAPGLYMFQDKVVDPWLERRTQPEFDAIDEPGNPVIIAGYGRVGQVVSRMLRMADVRFTALEASYQQVDFVRRFGNKVYYGDASRLELLEAAKTGDAKLFVLAIDDVEASVRTAEVVRRHFPGLPIVARARNRVHYFRLRDLGVRAIFRETFPASIEMGRTALLRLGTPGTATERVAALFRAHDEELLEAQYAVHHDEDQLMQTTREVSEQLREVFEADAVGPLALRAAGARHSAPGDDSADGAPPLRSGDAPGAGP